MRGREENLAAATRTHTFAREKIPPFLLAVVWNV